ncbi:proline/serine-rich coiled-coil protein 1 [Carettochelys insculpta]|uniref:proline/serine-rich coiled-coil protein 1 n=1 Tax=Carettochelys insculpta TaxID=44489 RepID=UPI003EBB97EC
MRAGLGPRSGRSAANPRAGRSRGSFERSPAPAVPRAPRQRCARDAAPRPDCGERAAGAGRCYPDSPWSTSIRPGAMELAEEGDVTFISDEKLDFGLSSPSDSREEVLSEQEEGQPAERGLAQRLDLHVQPREGASWSPLSAEKLEEIRKEANRLAMQLERCSLRETKNSSCKPPGATAQEPVGEPQAPVRLLHKERASPRSPRRETFVVKNSPVKALLPTVEPGLCPSPGARAMPTPSHLRHKLGSCSAGSTRLCKKATPSKPPAGSSTRRPQNSKKPSLLDLPHSQAPPAVETRGPVGLRLAPAQPRPAQEPRSPRSRAEPLQEAAAGGAKACRGKAASSRLAPGPRPSQARGTPAPVPSSHRLVPSAIPQPAHRGVALSVAGVPRRPSQLQPVGRGPAGGRGQSSAAGHRGPGPQRPAPPGSRLQLPRKVTLPSSPR